MPDGLKNFEVCFHLAVLLKFLTITVLGDRQTPNLCENMTLIKCIVSKLCMYVNQKNEHNYNTLVSPLQEKRATGSLMRSY